MSNKNILKILILCTVFAFAVGIASAEAPPNFPMGLYGNVNIGSSPAPVDTKIDGKVGTQLVASTKVVNAGKYGDNSNYLGIYAVTEGTNVDIYVNDVKVATVAYIPGISTKVDLNVPRTSAGTSNQLSGVPGNGGGGGSGAGVDPTVIAKQQQPITTKESIPRTPVTGTPVTGTPVGNPVTTPGGTQFYTILGVFGLLACAIIIFVMKKMGKI